MPRKKVCHSEGPSVFLLKPARAAEVLKISRQRIGQLIADGRLPVVVVAGRRFVHHDDVQWFGKLERVSDGSFRYPVESTADKALFRSRQKAARKIGVELSRG